MTADEDSSHNKQVDGAKGNKCQEKGMLNRQFPWPFTAASLTSTLLICKMGTVIVPYHRAAMKSKQHNICNVCFTKAPSTY